MVDQNLFIILHAVPLVLFHNRLLLVVENCLPHLLHLCSRFMFPLRIHILPPPFLVIALALHLPNLLIYHLTHLLLIRILPLLFPRGPQLSPRQFKKVILLTPPLPLLFPLLTHPRFLP